MDWKVWEFYTRVLCYRWQETESKLLHYIVDEGYEIYESFTEEEKWINAVKQHGQQTVPDEYTKVRDSLTKYFTPKKNLSSEVFKYRQCIQKDDENKTLFSPDCKLFSQHVNLKTIIVRSYLK